jgi:uroporphyrinogen decarboxylase
VQPYTARIFAELKGLAPPIHFSTGTTHLLEPIAQPGPNVVSVDWRLPLDVAWARSTGERGIQGNLDPVILLASWDVIAAEARDVLARAGGRPGHIFNLGHGIHPDTDPENLERLVELVHATAMR